MRIFEGIWHNQHSLLMLKSKTRTTVHDGNVRVISYFEDFVYDVIV